MSITRDIIPRSGEGRQAMPCGRTYPLHPLIQPPPPSFLPSFLLLLPSSLPLLSQIKRGRRKQRRGKAKVQQHGGDMGRQHVQKFFLPKNRFLRSVI